MSMGIENLAIFIGTGILLNLYPGPDTFYIIGRSLSQGRGAGICAALGISTGAVVHTLLGAFGLSAILATSASAFTVLKYLGAAYLIYQGIRLICEKPQPTDSSTTLSTPVGLWRIYRQGALTNILNPKVALFFLAFLPQFISATSPNKVLSFLALGTVFIITGTIWCLILAVFSSSLGKRLRNSEAMTVRLRKINGVLFGLLGLKLATARIEL
jgi:RhtB (resistance to homoserine/threonine) family protein